MDFKGLKTALEEKEAPTEQLAYWKRRLEGAAHGPGLAHRSPAPARGQPGAWLCHPL